MSGARTGSKITPVNKTTQLPIDKNGEVIGVMVQARLDKLENFTMVQHSFTKEKFFVHKDDSSCIGKEDKVLVYSSKFAQYFGPSGDYPDGHYTSKTRVFIGKFLEPAGQ